MRNWRELSTNVYQAALLEEMGKSEGFKKGGLLEKIFSQRPPAPPPPTKQEWSMLSEHFEKNPKIEIHADWELDEVTGVANWNVVMERRHEDWFTTHATEAGATAKRAGYVVDKFNLGPAADNVDFWLSVVASKIKHLSDYEVSNGGIIDDVVAKSALVCAQFKTEAKE